MAISTTFTLKFAGAAVEKGISRVQSAYKSLGGVAMKIGKALVSPFAGIAAAVGGLLAARSLIRTAWEMNMIGEAATTSEARLESIAASMGVFGSDVEKVTSRLSDLANEQGRLLGIDNKTIRLTQSKLMTFKEIAKTADAAGGAFDRATMAAVNMAQAGFGTAEMNAVQLGKALNDPIKGINSLTRSGITFTEQEKAKIRTLVESNRMLDAQDIILKAIEMQVGGAAKATSDASARMKESWAQLKESFGKPFSIQLGAIFDRISAKIPQLAEQARSWGEAVGRTMTQLVDAFEQGRLGDVFMAALDMGVAKLGEELLALMTHAGNTLFDALEERATKSNVFKVLTFGGLDVDTPRTKTGKDKTEMSYGELRQEYANMFGSQNNAEILRQTMQKQGNVPNAPGYRYAQPGEAATIMDGERVVRLLTSIDQRLAPPP
jgi:hypothetical protein